MHVGVIGLGAMGRAMAQNLCRSGVSVTAYDASPMAAQAFQDTGGETASSLDELFAKATCLLSVVNNQQQTESVIYKDGRLRSFQPGSIFLCCSTVPVGFMRSLSAALATQNVAVIDAPLSGGPARALDGTMTMFLSGPADAIALAKPVLDTLAQHQFMLGDACGVATSFKLINQVLAAGNLAVGCEAMALAEKLGLDPSRVLEVIGVSAGNSWMLQNVVRRHVAKDYEPKSSIDIFLKDVRVIREIATEMGAYTPFTSCVEDILKDAVAAGFTAIDGSALTRYLAQHPRE